MATNKTYATCQTKAFYLCPRCLSNFKKIQRVASTLLKKVIALTFVKVKGRCTLRSAWQPHPLLLLTCRTFKTRLTYFYISVRVPLKNKVFISTVVSLPPNTCFYNSKNEKLRLATNIWCRSMVLPLTWCSFWQALTGSLPANIAIDGLCSQSLSKSFHKIIMFFFLAKYHVRDHEICKLLHSNFSDTYLIFSQYKSGSVARPMHIWLREVPDQRHPSFRFLTVGPRQRCD